jgi:hypothetical protein
MITSDLFMDAHVGLISNRHPQPVEGYIWTDTIIDPLDFDVLESQAERWIDDVVKYDLDNQVLDTLFLYLSGLTSCTISFLKAWERKGYTLADNLVLMYHDRDTGLYNPQHWKS